MRCSTPFRIDVADRTGRNRLARLPPRPRPAPRVKSFEQSVAAIPPAVAAGPAADRRQPRPANAISTELQRVVTSRNRQPPPDHGGGDGRPDRRGAQRLPGQCAIPESRRDPRCGRHASRPKRTSLLAERRASEQRSGTLLKFVLGAAALLMLLAGAFIFYVAWRYIADLAQGPRSAVRPQHRPRRRSQAAHRRPPARQ